MANWKDYAKLAKAKAQKLAAGIEQKNRYAAMLNRMRTVIRCQEQAAEKEYMALGRYYYNALRDKETQVAEEHCKKLDHLNAMIDSTLKTLEEAVREQEAVSIGIIGGEDGPTNVYINEPKKESTLFHFGRGPLEITVTRDTVYHPEEDSEEIDLCGIESFDYDPMQEKTVSSAAAEAPAIKPKTLSEPEFTGAELDENDGLPFEG